MCNWLVCMAVWLCTMAKDLSILSCANIADRVTYDVKNRGWLS